MNTNEKTNTVDSKWNAFWGGVSRHWLRYAALLVTGSLTGYAAWSYTSNGLYVIALVLLAEGASLYWSLRIEDYGNVVQQGTAVIGTVVAWASIAVTDLASATIIVRGANLEIFSVFAQVPEWAQKTVVYVVPFLAVVQGVLATVHYFFSEEAALRRSIAQTNRETEKQIKQAEAEALKSAARARAQKFTELAKVEAPKLGEAQGVKSWHDTAQTLRVPTESPTVPMMAGKNGQHPDPLLPPSK